MFSTILTPLPSHPAGYPSILKTLLGGAAAQVCLAPGLAALVPAAHSGPCTSREREKLHWCGLTGVGASWGEGRIWVLQTGAGGPVL